MCGRVRPKARPDPGLRRRRAGRQGARVDRRRGHRPARLERVAVGPAPGGRRGDRARRRAPRTATRTRARRCCGGGSPSATRSSPAEVALANGSCEILLAAALALCEPGAELVYAWPSFSIYPYLAPLSGAREIRVPLAEGDVHDLDAIAAEITAATQLVAGLQPQQPDRDPPARRRGSPSSASACPTTSRCSSTRPTSSSSSTTTPTPRSTCAATSPTWSCCAPSARSTGSPGCGSATRCARRSSAPPSTPCASRSASTRSPRRRPPRRSAIRTTSPQRVERNLIERVMVEEGVRELGLADARLAGELLLDRPRRRATRRRSSRRWREAGILVRAGHPARRPRPHPGQLRHAGREPALSRRAG